MWRTMWQSQGYFLWKYFIQIGNECIRRRPYWWRLGWLMVFFNNYKRTKHITAWSFVMYMRVNSWHTWQMKLVKIKIIIENLNTNIRYWSLKVLHLLYQWISSRIIRQYFYLLLWCPTWCKCHYVGTSTCW